MRERGIDRSSDLRIDSLDHVLFGDTKPDSAQVAAPEISGIVGDRVVQAGRIERISPRNRVHEQRRIAHRLGEWADLIERRCKRDQTEARNAAIARLESHYTGKCRRLTE